MHTHTHTYTHIDTHGTHTTLYWVPELINAKSRMWLVFSVKLLVFSTLTCSEECNFV